MIQISIPEPPLGSRIRRLRTQRAAGYEADNSTHLCSAQEDDYRTGHELAFCFVSDGKA